ncbi:hypothetical protein EV363DRAFT_1173324, partial [Boletus edulis]
EWSENVGVSCCVMDIWSEEEVADLANLLRMDAKRMAALAKTWGGSSNFALVHSSRRTSHRKSCHRRCPKPIPSKLAWPNTYHKRSVSLDRGGLLSLAWFPRSLSRIYVLTPTLRTFLAEALQGQSQHVKEAFYRSLHLQEVYSLAVAFICESWSHSFFSSVREIQCQWFAHCCESDSVALLRGTTVPSLPGRHSGLGHHHIIRLLQKVSLVFRVPSSTGIFLHST